MGGLLGEGGMGGWAGPAATKETWHLATMKTWCCAKPEMTRSHGETSGDIGEDEEDLWLGRTNGRGRAWAQEVIRKSSSPD